MLIERSYTTFAALFVLDLVGLFVGGLVTTRVGETEVGIVEIGEPVIGAGETGDNVTGESVFGLAVGEEEEGDADVGALVSSEVTTFTCASKKFNMTIS